ncbi:hypothetical protein [Microbacterium sp. A93]|uniref:hypothetical protein n=1 Tax=unclassified Microbacterium TaxID=2609290 RepID=UPI003F43B4CA
MAGRRRTRAKYRRRRLAVFFGLLVLLAALAVGAWLIIAQPWADATTHHTSTSQPTSTPQETGEQSPSPEPSPEPSVEPTAEETPGIAPCQASDVTVEATTNAETYPAGSLPEFSIVLTNSGSEDCSIDVGSATQEFTVTSGNDLWWDSRHCQENPSSMVVTLAAGQSVPSAEPVIWDRTRSDVDTCAQENRPRAPGGGASYHLTVSIGGFTDATTRQFLLY